MSKLLLVGNKGEAYGGYKGDATNLDYSSCEAFSQHNKGRICWGLCMGTYR